MKAIARLIFLLSLFFCRIELGAQQGNAKFCVDAEPLCSGDFYYPNTSGANFAEIGPDYGCLTSQLNPAWFYFQIARDGDIEIMIEQSTIVGGIPNLDTDFIVYGPFDDLESSCGNLTSNNIADCSYARDFVEFVNIKNASVGSYYLLMIQNYSLSPGFVHITQTDGDATTNCVLVEEPILIKEEACQGAKYFIDASTPGAFLYKWYEDNGDGNYQQIYVSKSPFLEGSKSGIYKAEALNASNLVIQHFQFEVILLDSSPLNIYAELITNAFQERNNVQVSILEDEPDVYTYSIDGGGYQAEPIFDNVSRGQHVINAMSSNGCRIGSTIIDIVDYPLYFTPNGDGFNETWKINGQSQLQATVNIYDRYGKLIKQLGPNSTGWDGTFKGVPMPTSDYWFNVSYIEPRDGSQKNFTAHFTLKR